MCSNHARWALLVLAVPLAGCIGTLPKIPPPTSAQAALANINDNLAKITAPLYCAALVSFRLRDAEGRTHRFIGQDAVLIFQRPRCLYFNIKSALAGSVARVGSNDERYWLWVEPEVSKMWWGTWAALERGQSRKLAVPPDQLLDALAVRPLPEALPDSPKALLRVEGREYRLLYQRYDEHGWPYAAREITLDPGQRYLPVAVVDRDADGQELMRASLGGYQQIGRDGPYTARRYVLTWPPDDAEIRLDIHNAKLRLDQPPFCHFPAEPPVDSVECVDERAGAQVSQAVYPSVDS